MQLRWAKRHDLLTRRRGRHEHDTFRTSTQIETGAPVLDWLNNGVFISVVGRQPAGVVYETYLVG